MNEIRGPKHTPNAQHSKKTTYSGLVTQFVNQFSVTKRHRTPFYVNLFRKPVDGRVFFSIRGFRMLFLRQVAIFGISNTFGKRLFC